MGKQAATKEIKSVRDLQPDARNANKGTQRGTGLIEQSLEKYGTGRSILIDKHGRIIAGNKTTEGAVSIGIEDLIVVPTDGTKLVAVQRTDLDLDDPKARELAISDNRAGEVNLDWDAEILAGLAADGVDLSGLFYDNELAALAAQSAANIERLNSTDEWVGMPEFEAKDEPYKIVINFENESDREEFANAHDLYFIKKETKNWTTWHPFREREDLKSLKYE